MITFKMTDGKLQVNQQSGFTIIEMLIATSVLSVLLLVSALVIQNIGNTFYKVNTQSRVQDNVLSITNEISQELIHSTNVNNINVLPTAGTPGYFCVDNYRYTYVIGKQMSYPSNPKSNQTFHVLWRDSPTLPCATALPNLNNSVPSPGGTELIGSNSRLTAFCVGIYNSSSPSPCTKQPINSSAFNITIGAAYGDDDLLTQPTSTNAACKGSISDQFCATSFLTTIANNRM
jgi:prepilin-type N-terminal cleavage/methylation domain-containing protein